MNIALGLMKELQGLLKSAVHRNGPAPATFVDALSKQDLVAYGAVASEDHLPLEPCNFTCAQARLEAQQAITLFRSA